MGGRRNATATHLLSSELTLTYSPSCTTRDERGASSVEYALLLSVVAVILIVGIAFLGTRTAAMYDSPCTELAAAGNSC